MSGYGVSISAASRVTRGFSAPSHLFNSLPFLSNLRVSRACSPRRARAYRLISWFRSWHQHFVAAVIGGFDSLGGVVLSGLLLGVVETPSAAYVSSALGTASVFFLLFCVCWYGPRIVL
ncbi:MAG: Amino acid/amide transporter rane protein 1, family [Bradyrhizobium sp.]|nr:Amino acid/amide transporter rane protein 1, family [Bradyrhizobium sp.]